MRWGAWLGLTAVGNDELCDRLASKEMLVDDAIEHLRGAAAIPGTFGIHDGDRPTLANVEASALAANHLAMLFELELLEASAEMLPRMVHLFR